MSEKPATPRYDALRSEALKTPFDFDYLKIWAALLETEAALTAEREARQDMELKFGALALETAKAKDDLDEEREARERDNAAMLECLNNGTNTVSGAPEHIRLVREIHRALKRGEATEDHGLIGNLRCILDSVLPDIPYPGEEATKPIGLELDDSPVIVVGDSTVGPPMGTKLRAKSNKEQFAATAKWLANELEARRATQGDLQSFVRGHMQTILDLLRTYGD